MYPMDLVDQASCILRENDGVSRSYWLDIAIFFFTCLLFEHWWDRWWCSINKAVLYSHIAFMGRNLNCLKGHTSRAIIYRLWHNNNNNNRKLSSLHRFTGSLLNELAFKMCANVKWQGDNPDVLPKNFMVQTSVDSPFLWCAPIIQIYNHEEGAWKQVKTCILYMSIFVIFFIKKKKQVSHLIKVLQQAFSIVVCWR